MAGEEFARRDLSHIDIGGVRSQADYVYPPRNIERKAIRENHEAHARSLLDQLAAALPAAAPLAARLPIQGLKPGVLVQVETLDLPENSRSKARKLPPNLDFVTQDITVLHTTRNTSRTESAVVFVPDDARVFLQQRLQRYGADPGNQRRPDAEVFEPLERVQAVHGEALFAGEVDMASPEVRWWELWVRVNPNAPGREDGVAASARAQGLDVYPDRLKFPDTVVLFVHGVAAGLAAFASRIPGALTEIRKANGTARLFLDERRGAIGPHDWIGDMTVRITPPPAGAPVICVLDTGVAAAHPLIAPGLAGAWSYDEAWGSDDHERNGGHGTGVVALALHGDLVGPMADQRDLVLTHAVESVKYLTPRGFARPAPPSFGTITQGAVAIVEIARPHAARTFCIASSTDAFCPSRPSSWSGALDQLSAGSTIGDDLSVEMGQPRPSRLMLVATGNMIGGHADEVLRSHPIEDPAQSWNALTVGGYTTKDLIDPPAAGLSPLVDANDVSPYSCGSSEIPDDLTPIKPEVLFEAGNMARGADDHCGAHPALSLLTAGSDVMNRPLIPFEATSAAVGVAGNFLGQLKGALPGLWPETYRALTVHSARWPQPMLKRIQGRGAHWKTGSKGAKQKILREMGFGVPDLERAIRSARNDFTLLAQAEIQPYALTPEGTYARYKDMHFYDLPWPKAALEGLENEIVTLRITLSYFVQPNLSGRAATRPETYRSFGLRFAMKKRTETMEAFKQRISALEDGERVEKTDAKEADYWLLGSKSVSAGSLHCDLWRGHAIDLASHDAIAVFPVGGWWKSHLGQRRANSMARYALAISIDASGHAVDLASEVMTILDAGDIET